MCDVLLLEDDPLIRSVSAEALGDEGFEVREAGCGAQARAVLHERLGAKVLVADRDLRGRPGEPDGFAIAAEALRRDPALGVIYASSDAISLRARDLGPRERVLPKPFRLSELVRLTRELMR